MIVLARDTTTRGGSAAVVEDRRIRFELTGDAGRTHGERLPTELARALDVAAVQLEQVDLFAVAAGPGSFTGLRVGIAAMQGLAMATTRRIVPVSALDALARAAGEGSGLVATWMDAQRGQVFAALYGENGQPVGAPSALPPTQTLTTWRDELAASPVRFVGDGAVRYADRIRMALGDAAAIVEPPPLAGIIGVIAAEHPDWAVNPHAVVPIYIRRPDAELAKLKTRG